MPQITGAGVVGVSGLRRNDKELNRPYKKEVVKKAKKRKGNKIVFIREILDLLFRFVTINIYNFNF